MPRHRRAGAAVVTAGAVTTLVGTFLSWVRSGANGRSSYEIFGLVERLGFSPSGLVGWALRLWPLVPLALVLIVVAHWTHHPVLAWPRHTLSAVAIVYPGTTAVAVANAPDIGLFDVGAGPTVTLIGALMMLAGVVTPSAVSAIARVRPARPSAPVADRS